MASLVLFLWCFCVFLRVSYCREQTPLDVVLLIDSSDEYRSLHFQSEKLFLKDVIDQINPDNTNAKIALYTFGKAAFSQFTLDMYTTAFEMKLAVEYMWFATGNGKAETAIQSTILEAFGSGKGERECIPNILIVLTHSQLTNTTLISTIAQEVDVKRIQVIFINMAETSDTSNILTLTHTQEAILAVHDLTTLKTMAQNVTQMMFTHIPRTGCGQYAEWQQWGRCSVTCGLGLQFRTRTCEKEDPNDKDCDGRKTEDLYCDMPVCTDPVNGKWSSWQTWSTCTKTCETGVQTRERVCGSPAPEYGGKPCEGETREERTCSEWTCPDCTKTCPPGAHLQDCDLCVCTSITLFGRVINDMQEVVQNASIFLDSRRYSPIATTGSLGRFNVNGICILGETIYIQAQGHAGVHVEPTMVNNTHWTISNVTLQKYIAPLITVQPRSKVRLLGQDVTMCCRATGNPQPSTFKWFKDDAELLGMGTDGHLTLTSVQESDKGSYNCYVETDAGVTLSEKVVLEISENDVDSCDTPLPHLTHLPDGCFVTGDITKNNSVDVGTCGEAQCVNNRLHDNGSCAEYWPYHCCQPDQHEIIDIECEGFSYQMARLTSCVCGECRYVTTVSGRAYGRDNGIEIPLQVGEVRMHGEVVTHTNMGGFFRFEVPLGITRVVVMFSDPVFQRLFETTKIVQVKEGGETYFTAILPLMPDPVPFDSTNGTEISIGEGPHGLPAVGSLQISKDSLTDTNGNPFVGNAAIKLRYTDPRSMDSIDEANGLFETQSDNGEIVPLSTYGVLQFEIKDESGNDLHSNKPIRITLSSDAFDVPLDANGNPEVHYWDYDHNKGIWVDRGQMQILNEVSSPGSRRLLQSSRSYFIDQVPSDIPVTEINEEYTERVRQRHPIYGNLDYWVNVVKTRPKEGVCFVSVSVYSDIYYNEEYAVNDVTINVYVYNNTKRAFVSKSSRSVIQNGHACIEMFCDANITISVQRGRELFISKREQKVPDLLQYTSINGEYVNFHALDFGGDGPVYQRANVRRCENAKAQDASFMFQFGPRFRPPIIRFIEGKHTTNKRLSWYPQLPWGPKTIRACFIKLRVKISDNFDMHIIATSKIGDATLEQFGTVHMSAIPNERLGKDHYSDRAACIEYRCSGLIVNNGIYMDNISTVVDVNIVLLDKTVQCRMSSVHPDLGITENPTGSRPGFRFVSLPGVNYGSSFGVFINDQKPEIVEQVCKSGNMINPSADMDPTKNPAVEFDCM